MSRRPLTALCLTSLLFVAVAACGGSVAAGTDGAQSGTSSSSSGSSSDTGSVSRPGAGSPSGSGGTTGGECTAPLDTLVCTRGSAATDTWCCPSTFDATFASLPACDLGETQSYASCTGAKVLTRSYGTHAIQCFYSVTDDTLVGAQKQDDIPSFCNQTSRYVKGGASPAPSCVPDSLERVTCPHDASGDAGTDGG